MGDPTITTVVSEETLNLVGRYVARRLSRVLKGQALFLVIEDGAKPWARLLTHEFWQVSNSKPQTVGIKASSYVGQQSTGSVRLQIDETASSVLRATALGQRSIVIVEDVIESGRTMEAVATYLVGIGFPEERIIIASMLYKHGLGAVSHRVCDEVLYATSHALPVFVGLEMNTDIFVVGFGLDLDNQYRELPYIGSYRENGEQA